MASKVKVIKGEDRVLNFQISDEDTQGYFDLTTATAITACFKNQDLTTLSKTLASGAVAIVTAIAGKLSVTLTDTETALMYADDAAPVYIMIDVGSTRRIVTKGLEMALSVEEKPF